MVEFMREGLLQISCKCFSILGLRGFVAGVVKKVGPLRLDHEPRLRTFRPTARWRRTARYRTSSKLAECGVGLSTVDADPSIWQSEQSVPKCCERRTNPALRSHPIQRIIDARQSKAVENGRFGALWMFACHTGIRPSEIYALTWSDVDFTSKTVRVRRGLDLITDSCCRLVEREARRDEARREVTTTGRV